VNVYVTGQWWTSACEKSWTSHFKRRKKLLIGALSLQRSSVGTFPRLSTSTRWKRTAFWMNPRWTKTHEAEPTSTADTHVTMHMSTVLYVFNQCQTFWTSSDCRTLHSINILHFRALFQLFVYGTTWSFTASIPTSAVNSSIFPLVKATPAYVVNTTFSSCAYWATNHWTACSTALLFKINVNSTTFALLDAFRSHVVGCQLKLKFPYFTGIQTCHVTDNVEVPNVVAFWTRDFKATTCIIGFVQNERPNVRNQRLRTYRYTTNYQLLTHHHCLLGPK